MKVSIDNEDFGTLCICAIRYCQGRQTYMPSHVQWIVSQFLEKLTDKDLTVMIDDCKHQKNMELYGDPVIDKPGWIRWEEALKKERERRQKK